jgi:hypothetical protein
MGANQSQSKKPWSLILIILLLSVIGVLGYRYYQAEQQPAPLSSPQLVINNPSPVVSPVTKADPIANLKTYKSQDNYVTFEYPAKLSDLISSKQFSISIKTKQEIIDEYAQYKESGCPSTCGRFVDDPALLLKQFDILTTVGNSPTCAISTTDQEEIKKDYILHTGGIGGKKLVEGIKTSNGQCGLKFIESDGFDVSIRNYYYKTSFIVDNNIVDIRFNIFPFDSFESVDKLWSDIGYDDTSGCDATCYEKETDYFMSFSVDNKIEKEVIQAYDQIISSIKFN